MSKILKSGAYAIGLCVLGALGSVFYTSEAGLRLRAQLGHSSAEFTLALRDYQQGNTASSFATFERLVLGGYAPAIVMMCDTLNKRKSEPAMGETCIDAGEGSPETRLKQLSDLAFFAQEWGVLSELLQRRVDEGDADAHFDLARYEALSRPEMLDVPRIIEHLAASAKSDDPRGHYLLAVAELGNVADAGGQALIGSSFAEALIRKPVLTKAEAYFELAKLMQSGLLSSKLSYVDVLEKADALGSPYAAGYLAQYYANNPDVTAPEGKPLAYWMKRAADFGDPVAQFNWATHLLSSQPDEAADREALKLLRASAGNGFAPSHTRLGTLLWQKPALNSDDPEEGRKQALIHLERATELGDANASFNLGQIAIAMGQHDKAKAYLTHSAERGNELAAQALAQLR